MIANKKRYFFFSFVAFLFSIVLIEVMLNFLAAISTSVSSIVMPTNIPVLDDNILGYRPNPNHPEHDKKGFRNPYVPAQTDILAFGDSQTYGTGVAPYQTWPRILEDLAGKITYSMAYGGYCPVHSLALWKEGMELQPKIVVEALYLGNDLFDAFDLVYNQGTLSKLKTKDSLMQSEINSLETTAPIKEQVINLFTMGKGSNKEQPSLRLFLSRHSRVYGLFRSIWKAIPKKNKEEKDHILWNKEKEFAKQHVDYCEILEDEQFKTIFTSTYRKVALDTTDIRIKEGLNIALKAIKEMSILAKQRNIEFIVLGIPTKELVFQPFLQKTRPEFQKIADLESSIWQKSKIYFEKNDIHFVDGLKPLRIQLESGKQPYHQSKDGHINELGHTEMARSLYSFFEE